MQKVMERSTNPSAQMLIRGSGEMADRIRAFSWASTPLGPLAEWSSELVSIINLMLSLPTLAAVFLGPDLLLLYNDAYTAILDGKHPHALGQPARETWSEAWPLLAPGFDAARAGQSRSWEEVLIPIVRENVGLQDQYWTYTLNPVYLEGKVAGVFNVGHNVTAKVLADKLHQETTRQLGQVLDATSDGVLSVDRNWRITYVNRRGKEILSPLGDLVGHLFAEKFPDTIYQGSPYLGRYRSTMEDRVATHFDAFYPGPLSSWFSILCEPSEDGIVIFFRDVTEERREASALRESEARLKAIYSTSVEYIGLLSPQGHILDLNDASLGFDDCSREDVLGKRFWTGPWFKYTPGVSEIVEAGVARAAAGEHVHTELALNRPNGDVVTFDFSMSPVRDESGKIVYIVPEGYDISPLKRAQALLIQNEKLAAVGRLASSIAHEINNPLESVTNLLYLAKGSDEPSQVREYLEIAERELRRVASISSQTLRFHRQSSMPRSITSEELLSTVLAIQHGRLLNSQITLEQGTLSPTPVLCFEGEIRQVLNNLIANAIDAISPKGGRLVLRSRESIDWPTGRRGLRITVADTGSGISQKAIKRIFEPFFTTKGMAGTGLGLWVSREIVERHKGALSVRSRQHDTNPGTVFSLFLPFEAVTR